MKIATWNVNSIRARLPNLLAWLDGEAPDVALLQETKTTDDAFPRLEIEERGYVLRRRRPEELQRRRHPVEVSARRRRRHAAGRRRRRPGALRRGMGRRGRGRIARRLDLPAQWQPGGERQIPLQAGVDGASRGARRGAARGRGSGRSRRRLQRDSGAGGRLGPGRLGRRRPVPPGDAAALSRVAESRLHGGVPGPARRGRPLQLLGLSGPCVRGRPGPAHRPSPAFAAGRRPARGVRHRFETAWADPGPPTIRPCGASSTTPAVARRRTDRDGAEGCARTQRARRG